MLYVLYSIYAENGNEILMIAGSGFRVQGSGFNGFRWRLRRILDDGILVSSAFPSRGRCPVGADRAPAI